MTEGSDIVLWDVLRHSFPYSRLDGPPGSLTFSSLGRSQIPRTRSLCCLFLVFIPICFLAFLWYRKENHTRTRSALRALLTVIAPTCSLWPRRYIELASGPRSRVNIPLEAIIKDTSDGIIEFCNPINDLADLIGSGLTVDGHTICISTGWKWWISCFQQWMLFKFKIECMPWLSDRVHDNLPLLCLDYLPDDTTLPLDTGRGVTLEFTAFSPSLQVLSTPQIISAIPFIISEGSRRWPRPLVTVLRQLNNLYGPNLVVDSLSNISAEYENVLQHVYTSSSREQKIREMQVKNQGIKAWRRDMFLVALEAALVRQGWIERWAVQVTTK